MEDIFPGPPPDKASLQDISRTCSLFRQLTEPLLYERLKFRVHDDAAEKLVNHLRTHPQKRRWIKYVVVIGRYNEPFEPVLNRPLLPEYFTTIFPALQELKGVRLVGLELSAQLVDIILRRPTLQVWDSEEVAVQGHCDTSFVTHLRRLRITRLAQHPDGWWLSILTHAPSLESFILANTPFNTQYAVNMLDSIPPTTLQNLIHLGLPDNLPPLHHIPHLLQQCAKVTSLHIGWIDVENDPPPLDPTFVLQSLEHFEGPASLAKLLVPGRPVKSVRLSSDKIEISATRELLSQSFALSSRPIAVLQLTLCGEWNHNLFANIADTLTELEELHLDFWGVDRDPSTATSPPVRSLRPGSIQVEDVQPDLIRLAPLTSLREVRFRFVELYRVLGREMDVSEEGVVRDLARQHSRLECVGPGLDGARLWKWNRASGLWSLHILLVSNSFVSIRCQDLPDEVLLGLRAAVKSRQCRYPGLGEQLETAEYCVNDKPKGLPRMIPCPMASVRMFRLKDADDNLATRHPSRGNSTLGLSRASQQLPAHSSSGDLLQCACCFHYVGPLLHTFFELFVVVRKLSSLCTRYA